MKHLHYYVALLCLLFSSNYSCAQWQQCNGPASIQVTCIERVNNTILTGTQGGVYQSTDNGVTWSLRHDLRGKITDILYHNSVVMIAYLRDDDNVPCIKTSFNDGQSWTTKAITQYVSYCPYMVLIPFGDAVLLQDYSTYIATTDYGSTWQPMPFPYLGSYLHNISIDSTVIAATFFTSDFNNSILYVSTDLNSPWKYIDSSGLIYGLHIHDSTIIISRANYIPGYWQQRLCKSSDMGLTWDTVYTIPDSSIIFDFHRYNNKLYASGDKSVFSSADNGSTWAPDTMPTYCIYNKITLTNGNQLISHYPEGVAEYNPVTNTSQQRVTGIYPHYVYTMAEHNNRLYCSTEQNVFISNDEGNTWQLAGVPQTGVTDFQFSGDTIMGVTDNYLITSFDNGSTWSFTTLYCHTNIPFKTIEYENGKIYVNSDSIKYSTDFSATWYALPTLPDSTIGGTHYDKDGVIELFNHRLYAVNNNGYIFRYDETATKWDILFKAPAAEHYELYTLGNAFVASGYHQLWVTYNDGATWQQPAMQGLPPQTTPHNLTTVNGLWLGTCEDYAVYASADSGNTWSPFYTGTPPFRASKRGGIAILNNKLFAGTHYQSVWKYEGNLEIPTSIKTLTHANLLVYPNPTDNLLYIQLPENTGSASTLTIYNSNGVLVISQPATTYLTTVNTSQLPAGLYTGSVNSNSGISRFKFIVTR